METGSRGLIVLAALVAASLASLAWLAHPWYDITAPGTADASVYLLCARSLAAGEGYTYLGMPFNVRPPGFSVLLAPLVASRGFDFHAINLLVGAFGVALVALLFDFARPRIGTLLAACVAVVVWMSPAIRSMSNQVMSDVPGAALLFAALAIERRARTSASVRASWRGDLATGLAIAAATYVRSVNLLLAPAILLSRRFAPREPADGPRGEGLRSALAIAGVPLLLLLPWVVRDARSHPPWPAEQTAAATYATAFLHMDWGDPDSPRVPVGDYVARVPAQVGDTLATIGRRLGPGSFRPLDAVLGAVVLAALLAAAIRRRGAAELFALLVLLELAVHPAFDERLALPIALVGLVALVEVVRGAIARFAPPRIAQGAVVALLLALLVGDFDPRPNWDAIAADFRARRDIASACNASLPADSKLASNIGWHWSVFLERPVYSLFFVARRKGGPAGAEPVIDAHGINTILLRADPPEDPVFLNYFAQRYGAPAFVGTDGGKAALFRVRR